MTKSDFTNQLQNLLPDCDKTAVFNWIVFAEDCVNHSQYVDFTPMPSETESTEKWLDSIFTGLKFVKNEYGESIANQICTLSTTQQCLYPGEMDAAAKHFQCGGGAEEIDELIESGKLEGDSLFVPRAKKPQRTEKSYVIAVCTDSDFYIPNAEHIERNDDLVPWAVPDDIVAAQAAIQDGVCLIRGMDGVPDDVYLDTDENRAIIKNALAQRLYKEEATQNRARIYSDMPDCVRLLSELEKELGGNSGSFAEWLKISYELNSDFDVRPLDMATLICDALKESKHLHGTKIARDLYDARTVVLPNEIRSASRFLSLGGPMESLDGLAHAGFLMEDLHAYGHGDIVRVAEFMSVGGAAEDAFAVLLSGEPEAHAEMSQQMG